MIKKSVRNPIFLLISLVLALSFGETAEGIAQPTIELTTFASGFSSPTSIAHAHDGRLFITQRNGVIRIIDNGGQILPNPFLDINPIVINAGGQSEQGLLGLAFHPNFQFNGFFYLNYIGNDGNTRISRFSVSASNPNIADANSEEIIMVIPQPFANHNGGCLQFGPDGYLYIGMGDGGAFDDPQNNGQNRLSLLGKMLRIDVDNGFPYSIPTTNPFADDDFTLDEIWALGLRNPWRFSFDRLTGDMWIGDVGQGQWEEVNFQPASSSGGENYGWRCYEGTEPYIGSCSSGDSLIFPVAQYPHPSGFGCASITGGFVYRGLNYPDLYGWYIYADYCSQEIWGVHQLGTEWEHVMLGDFAGPYSFVSFGENHSGEIFVATLQGTIYRIQSTLCNSLAATSQTTVDCDNQENGTINISISGGTPPYSVIPSNFDNLSAGTYEYTIEDVNNCQINIETTIEAASLPDFPPQLSFDLPSGNLEVIDTFDYYQWYLDGLPIANANSFMYNWNQIPGVYSVEIGDSPDCTIFSESMALTIDAISEISSFQKWEVYPNPAHHFVYFKSSMNFSNGQDYHYKIFDINGKLQKSIYSDKSLNKLDIHDLPMGIFFVVFTSRDSVYYSSLVKSE